MSLMKLVTISSGGTDQPESHRSSEKGSESVNGAANDTTHKTECSTDDAGGTLSRSEGIDVQHILTHQHHCSLQPLPPLDETSHT